jgi:hypothetical protein
MLPLAAVLLLATALQLAPRSAPAQQPAVSIPQTLAAFNAHARFPLPDLSTTQVERLEAGKVVKIRQVSEEDGAPQRAIGLLRSNQPAAGLWLSARDVHFTAIDELTEVQLTPPGQWPAQWYQYLDLPRPISDRHWVVDVTDTHALARATGAWEHAWVLAKDGPRLGLAAVAAARVPEVDEVQAANAIYTPRNDGAWLVIDLGDGTTLLGYHVTSVIGGAIPDKLVADYTLFTLGKLLKGVEERTPTVIEHYDAAHEPIEGGDGVAIPPHLGR